MVISTFETLPTNTAHWKRNKKVARTPRLRRLTGAHRAMTLVVRVTPRADLGEVGERPEERTSTSLGFHAQARPHPRPSLPLLALLAPLDGHAGPPCHLCLCRARIDTHDKDAQHPFCSASRPRRGPRLYRR